MTRMRRLCLVLSVVWWGLSVVAGVLFTVWLSPPALSEFAQDHNSMLGRATGEYLDGLSATILPALVRRDARELADVLDHAQDKNFPAYKPRFAIVELPDGTIFASSDPLRFPMQSVVPHELRSRFAAGDGLKVAADTDRAWLARTLRTEGSSLGRLLAGVDIHASFRFWREISLMVAPLSGCVTLAYAIGGYFLLRRELSYRQNEE